MKTLIKNKLGLKTHSFRLPADDVVAKAFCESMLDGEYVGYASQGVVGTDTATGYMQVAVMVKNTAGLKTYLNMACKSTKSETDIYTALKDKTFNGVKADHLAIISMRHVSLA